MWRRFISVGYKFKQLRSAAPSSAGWVNLTTKQLTKFHLRSTGCCRKTNQPNESNAIYNFDLKSLQRLPRFEHAIYLKPSKLRYARANPKYPAGICCCCLQLPIDGVKINLAKLSCDVFFSFIDISILWIYSRYLRVWSRVPLRGHFAPELKMSENNEK